MTDDVYETSLASSALSSRNNYLQTANDADDVTNDVWPRRRYASRRPYRR